MKTKITIGLEIEAPDWIALEGDTRTLLENIVYSLKDFPYKTDYAEWSESGRRISKVVDIAPTSESKGIITLIPEYIHTPQIEIQVPKRGWGWPALAKKRHYWLENESVAICGRWMYTGELHDEEAYHKDSENNCKVCQSKIAKLQTKKDNKV
jgi:hypothetical protein